MSTETGPDVQVLIVGMGPTGAALAGLLGQRGVRCAVLDKQPSLYPLPRAIGMDQEVMRIAQELTVTSRLDGHVAPYRPSVYHGVDGQVIKRFDSPPPPHRLGWDPMFAFNQPAFETALRDRIAELPSVSVELETTVAAVGQDANGVWVDLVQPDAAALRRIRGDYLVACDGGSSPVRTNLGITMTDLEFHENWLVVDAIIEDDDVLARLPQTHVQYCDPQRPATFVNLVDRHRRWEISLEPGELPVGPVDVEDVWPWLDRWVKPGEARLWRAAAYLFHGLVADEWRRGRILLAGDAVHMTPPFSAQGMAAGMRDVQNLAWKLNSVLDGGAPETLLDTYQLERRPHVITTTQYTISLGRVIGERDEAAARARDAQLFAEHGGEVPVTYRTEFLPPLVDGLIARDTPGAGQVLPQPFVQRGEAAVRLDDLVSPGFRVVVAAAAEVELNRLRTAVAPLGGSVIRIGETALAEAAAGQPGSFIECDGVLTRWLEAVGSTIAIARPDHYIYATASSTAEAVALLDDLVATCGRPKRGD
ncbi:bifunctional 3-(3-hydroxy-phenyl)propionate/3-hydroxycinnamic acid hydroxylase [Nocardioides sp. KIGAM211]|uniref:Bifunctional 3-(3-hydroxy-phenyl)propionate/3-hydroxycinnamic acid hydroxylase n=1 Tax=Nocardioides luti TaxID=2761101 RepID=A0A7X0RGM6_9ACTN|nr:bifunctional 3-(3-hydroxy-phenyl)propionate/3-hydroxycinnamic acid hydroxylase [Nocardioides luti]